MKNILEEIKKIINENIKKYMPDLKSSDLEENGTIYYMNSQNGTEWDYNANEHLSPFMVFYNNKENLGIAKLLVYNDGTSILYLYNENGKKLYKTIETKINVKDNELLKFAVLLKTQMDDKSIWNANINKIDVTKYPTEEEINNFIKVEE